MKISEKTKFLCCSYVSIAEEMNPLHRNTMEDSYRVVDGFFQPDQEKSGFFAVYDGHGGREVSTFLQHRFDQNLQEQLLLNDNQNDSIEEKIKRAFYITDIECCTELSGMAGSTAVTCLFDFSNGVRTIYTANIGDSRAVLCKSRKAIRLSKDHKPEDDDEKVRITKLGGMVSKSDRVFATLAVSRSFGDKDLKPFVAADPYISATRIESTVDCPFLILACDGIWDELSDEEAVQIVLNLDESQRKNAAQFLVKEAMKRESYDNITALVVYL